MENSSESKIQPVQKYRVLGPPVDVLVISTSNAAEPFITIWRETGNQGWRGGPIEPAKDADHKLNYQIVDAANLRITFKPTAQEAFGASSGADCPAAGDNGGGEIDFDQSDVGNQGRTLSIRDRNHQPGPLKYALFFESPTGDKKYDPIIQNTGGGPGYAE